MDSFTSDFITQKALRYGLHSCSHCQAVLIDLTSLTLLDNKCDEVGGQEMCVAKEASFDEKAISLYYENILFRQFFFSGDTVAEAMPSCPFFELLAETGHDGKWSMNISQLSDQPSPFYDGLLHLRLPREITSLISNFENYGAPIGPCLTTEKTFARARERLRECLSKHKDCKQTGIPPSRLMDVRQDKIRLVNTESLHDPAWAALSYCWGGPQEAQTTHLNIQDRYQEITEEELPLTIQDAIHVCRQMHIPYLWVDSLCIIQADSKSGEKAGDSDKDRELRKMAGIFSGAVLTISASSASSSKNGFLQDREAWPPGIALPVRVNETYDIAQLVELPDHMQLQLDSEPADSRAWIFQEKALSCRTLNFVNLGMRLECRYTSRFIFQEDEYDLCQFHISYRDWRTLVENYSRRDLSDIRDRPIAIAAVAERFAAVSKDLVVSDYAAGLWKPTLVEDLLWCVRRYKSNRSIKLEGPSWSWTSVYASVNWTSFRSCSTTATIISTDVVLADPKSMFGATVTGTIRLKGRITKTSRRITSCPRRLWYAWDREPETDGVFFLELMNRGPWNLARRFGLMLQVTENPGEFVRVGCFSEWMPRECESLLNVSCKKCIEGSGRDDYVGWTCDNEERVIDII